MVNLTKLALSDNFTAFATLLSLLGDAALFVLTIYTFHLTAISRKLELISPSFDFSTFYGNRIGFQIMNKSLHAIPVTNVFLMKRIGKEFFSINIASFSNEPIAIESWTIKKIESEPFTTIWGYEGSMHDLIQDAVLCVQYGHRCLWVKPYKNAPLRGARRAYRKRDFQILTVGRKVVNEQVLSEKVDCVIYLRTKDINEQATLQTVFGITHFDEGRSVLLSESINGYSALGIPGDSIEQIEDALIEMGFRSEDVSVEMIGRDMLGEESDDEQN